MHIFAIEIHFFLRSHCEKMGGNSEIIAHGFKINFRHRSNSKTPNYGTLKLKNSSNHIIVFALKSKAKVAKCLTGFFFSIRQFKLKIFKGITEVVQ